eukprot:scaffold46909_cov51-Phaeocystis_antarctica.AAC.1
MELSRSSTARTSSELRKQSISWKKNTDYAYGSDPPYTHTPSPLARPKPTHSCCDCAPETGAPRARQPSAIGRPYRLPQTRAGQRRTLAALDELARARLLRPLQERVAELGRSVALAHGAHLVGEHGGVDGDGLLEHGEHGLLDLGARVVEMHEQPAQQVLEVGAVEVGAVRRVVGRVVGRVEEVDERRAHLEADAVAGVVESLEELGVERARVGLRQPGRAELAQHLADGLAAEAARLGVVVVEAREQHWGGVRVRVSARVRARRLGVGGYRAARSRSCRAAASARRGRAAAGARRRAWRRGAPGEGEGLGLGLGLDAEHGGEAHLLGHAPRAPHEVGQQHRRQHVLRPPGCDTGTAWRHGDAASDHAGLQPLVTWGCSL